MPQSAAEQMPDLAAEMTQDEATAAHLVFSHLPDEPDADDGNLESPGAMPIARSLLTAAFMFFIAFAAWLLGWTFFVVVFCVVGVVFFVAFFAFGQRLIARALGRAERHPYETEPWAWGGHEPSPEVAERVELLGGYLADPANPILRMRLQPLPRGRRRHVLANREDEAERSARWMRQLRAQGAGLERIEVEAEDGVRLVAHELACAPASRRWLVFAHDLGGSWTEGLPLARRLAERGYNLLLCEMRGHGESGGEHVGLGWLDRRDLLCWVRDLAARRGDGVEVVLMGLAMGGTAVCLAAGEPDLPPQVRAVVSDSAPVDTWNLLLQRIRYTGLEPHPTADFARMMFRLRGDGYDVAAGDAESGVAAATVPCLFLHGRWDLEISAYHASRLYMAAGGRDAGNRLATFPAAAHCLSCLTDPEGYFGALWDFLDPLV